MRSLQSLFVPVLIASSGLPTNNLVTASGAPTITLWPPQWVPPTAGDAENQWCGPCFVSHQDEYGIGVLSLALKEDADPDSLDSWQCSIQGWQTVANPEKHAIAHSDGKLYDAETKCSGGSSHLTGQTADELRQKGEMWKLNGATCDKAPVPYTKNDSWQGQCSTIGKPGKTYTQQTWSIQTKGSTVCSISWEKDVEKLITTGNVDADGKCMFEYGEDYVNISGELAGGVSLKTNYGDHYLTAQGTGACPDDYRNKWPIGGDLDEACDIHANDEVGFKVTGALTFGSAASAPNK